MSKKKLAVIIIDILAIITMIIIGLANVQNKSNFSTDTEHRFDISVQTQSKKVKSNQKFIIDLDVSDIYMGEYGINTIIADLNYDKTIFEDFKILGVNDKEKWNVKQDSKNINTFYFYSITSGTKDNQRFARIELKLKENVKPQLTQIRLSNIKSSTGKDIVTISDKTLELRVNGYNNAHLDFHKYDLITTILIIAIFVLVIINIWAFIDKKIIKILLTVIAIIIFILLFLVFDEYKKQENKIDIIPVKEKVIIDYSGKNVLKVNSKRTVSDLINEFLNQGKTITIYDENNNIIINGILKPGMIVKVAEDNSELYISIAGDYNNDGQFDVSDITNIIRDIVTKEDLKVDGTNNNIDVDSDNDIDEIDVEKLFELIENEIVEDTFNDENEENHPNEEPSNQNNTQPNEETPNQNNTQPNEETPNQNNTQPNEETPNQNNTQPNEETPNQNNTQPNEETPNQDNTQPNEETQKPNPNPPKDDVEKASYKIEHYLESVDGIYEIHELENLIGQVNQKVIAKSKNYVGFTENKEHAEKISEGTINSDGNLVLKLYYTRNEYDLNVIAGDYITNVSGTGKYKFGQNIEIKAELENIPGYTYKNFEWETTGDIKDNQSPITIVKMPSENLEIKASQERETINYKLKFNLDNGQTESENKNEFTVEDEDFTVINPTKKGYTFVGWTGTDITTPVQTLVITKGTTGDREYTANWIINEYTISYNLNDGTIEGSNPEKYTIETEDIIVKNPIKEGYTFAGWTGTELENPTKDLIIKRGSIENREYIANWKANKNTKYKIEHYIEELDGTYTLKETDNQEGETDVTALAKVKEYTGFSENQTHENRVAEGTIKPDGSLVLKLYYSRNEYDLTIKSEKYITSVTGTGKYKYEQEVEITAEKENLPGYTYSNFRWETKDSSILTNSTETITKVKVPAENTEITAKQDRNINEYTIKYNLNGGTTEKQNPEKYTVETENITLVNPSKQGYTFIGWTEINNTELTQTAVILKGSIGNKEYTANWEANKDTEYKVEHYIEELDGKYTLKETDNLKGETDIIATGVAKQYTGFTENQTHENRVSEGTIKPNGSLVLKLYYSRNEYNLTITSGQNITNTTGTGKYKFEQEVEITAEKENLPGYTYTNFRWETQDSTILTNTTKTTTKVKIPANNIEVIAKQDRTVNEYIISYNLNDGIVEGTNPEKYTVETENITLINPTKQGYTFIGWTGTDIQTPVENVVIEKGTIGNKEYTANWKENGDTPYKVEHYKEQLDGKYIIENETYTQNLTAATDSEVIATALNLEGYTENTEHKDRVEKGNVKPDGSLVLRLYYSRNEYDLTVTSGDNILTTTGTGTYKYGQEVEIKAELENKQGYTYSNFRWETQNPTILTNTTELTTKVKIPAGNVEVIAKQDRTVNEYTISYNLNDGTVEGTNPEKYTVETEDITLINPTKQGYTFTGWTGTELEELTKTVVISKGSIENREYTANWKANENTPYKVEHYIEELDGTYTLKETDDLEGKTGIDVFADIYMYSGFTENRAHPDRIEYGTIKPDGSLVLKIYYSRNEYELTVTAGNYITSVTGSGKYKYEQEVEITAEKENLPGYTYSNFKWDKKELANIENTTETTTKVKIPANNLEVIANQERTINEYTISYNLNDGTVEGTNPDKYTVETENITLINPTKTGYTFTGWTGTDLADLTQTVVIPKGTTGNKEYTANWETNKDTDYKVEHYIEKLDGTYILKETDNLEGETETSVTAVAKDYIGFTEKQTHENRVSEGIIKPDGSLVLELYYSRNEYDLTVTAGDYITNTSGSGKYKFEQEVEIKASLENQKGYTYTNFRWETENTSIIANQTEVKTKVTIPAKSIEIIAKQERTLNEYTITYDLANGVIEGTNPEKYTIETENITLINPSKPGYKFTGWTGTDLTEKTNTVVIEKGSLGNREYTANWEPNKLTINYYSNNATESFDNALNQVAEGENVLVFTFDVAYDAGARENGLHDYTLEESSLYLARTGYKATGNWGTEPTGGIIVNQSTSWESTESFANLVGKSLQTGNATINLYPIWESNKDTIYKVEHYIEELDGTYTLKETDKLSGETETTATAVAKGYTGFTENLIHTDRMPSGTIYPDGSLVLKLYYSRNEYDLTVTAGNYITNTTGTGKYKYEQEVEITAEKENLPGYTYSNFEWETVDPIIITNTKETTTKVKVPANNVEVKAKQERIAKEYTISYNLNNGTIEGSNPEKYTVETEDITLINPNKEGYIFTGWTGTDLTELTPNVVIPKGSLENREYTANWETVEYIISYNLNDGTLEGTNPEKYTIETEDITLINPTKSGYIFAGWTGTDIEEVSENITIEKGSTGNREYTANWVEVVASTTIDSITTNYASVQDAIDAAGTNTGAKVTLLKDEIVENVTVAKGQDIVLDTNGKTLTSDTSTIVNYGNLVIDGAGIITTMEKTPAVFSRDGELRIINGNIIALDTYTTAIWSTSSDDIIIGTENDTSTEKPYVKGFIYSEMDGDIYVHSGLIEGTTWRALSGRKNIVVTGGKITVSGTQEYTYAITGSSADSVIKISGGIIESYSSIAVTTMDLNGGKIEISGGSIYSEKSYAVNNSLGETLITGGTISSGATAIRTTTGSLTITGGTIEGKESAITATTGKITLGIDSEETPSITTPKIIAGTNGIDGGSVLNFYDGIIMESSVDGATITNVAEINTPDGYCVENGTETIDGTEYETSYLAMKKYEVTFDANGGTASFANKDVITNMPYGSLPTVEEREGYEFLGWRTEKNQISGNQEDWESGAIDIAGTLSDNSNRLRLKDYLKVSSNAQYILTTNNSNSISFRIVLLYDKDYNLIKCIDVWKEGVEFATPENCEYIKVTLIKGRSQEGLPISLEDLANANIELYATITENTKVIEESNHTLKAAWRENVASTTINDVTTIYESVQDAVNAAGTNEGAIVTLLKNEITESIIIAENQNIVLNTNGKTLSFDERVVKNKGTLNITGTGSIIATGVYNDDETEKGYAVNNIGTLKVTDGNIQGRIGIKQEKPSGTITIDGGNISGTYVGISSALKTTINGGTISGEEHALYLWGDGDVEINNGKLNCSEHYAIVQDGTGTITVNNGEITGSGCILNNSTANIIINDGTVDSKGRHAVRNYTGNIEVNGGNIKSESLLDGIWTSSTGNITVTGGTITGGTNGVVTTGTGTITITGGVITGYNGNAVADLGPETSVITIGNNEDTDIANKTSPVLIGSVIGVKSWESTFNFYDGIIKAPEGKTISGSVINTPTGYRIINGTETIDGVEYETAYLDDTYHVTFNENYENSTTTTKDVKYNTAIGELLTVSREQYIFDGWYTAEVDGEKITPETLITSDTTFYAHWLDIVASTTIGETTTYYETVQKAIDSAEENKATITLLKDEITESVTVAEEQDIVLDTNGKTLNSDATTITNNGNLEIIGNGNIKTIADSVEDPKDIENVTYIVKNNGNTTLNGATLFTETASGIYNSVDGTFTMLEGNIETNLQFAIVNCGNSNTLEKPSLKISGGNVKSVTTCLSIWGTGISHITNGTMTASSTSLYSTIALQSDGTLRIDDGNIISNNYNAITLYSETLSKLNGKIQINGGNINGVCGIANYRGGEIEITGGTIIGTDTAINAPYDNAVSIKVSGDSTVVQGNTYGIDAKVGNLTITDGKITSLGDTAIYKRSGTITLGNNDDSVSTTKPEIIGAKKGIELLNSDIEFNFYDGIIKAPQDSTIVGTVTNLPTGYQIVNGLETIDEVEYETAYLVPTNVVATTKIGQQVTYYQTVQEAIDAAGTNEGATVTLLKDEITESVTIAENQNIIFDLNGKTLTNSGKPTLYNHGTVNVIGDGEIQGKGGSLIHTVTNYGTFIKDGPSTISNTNAATNYAVHNESTGTFILNEGTISSADRGMYNESVIIINGGNVESVDYGIYNDSSVITEENPSIKITGGTLNSQNESGIYNNLNGTVVVTGGNITGKDGIYNISNGKIILGTNEENPQVSITEPCITATNIGIRVNTGTLDFYDGIIKGATGKSISGTVSSKPLQHIVEKGTETIDETTYETAYLVFGGVASTTIGESTIVYETVQEAINAAGTNEGATVTLLKDEITESVTIAENQNIVFDLNGKTLKYSTTPTVYNYGTTTITGDGEISGSGGSSIHTITNHGTLIKDGNGILSNTSTSGNYVIHNKSTGTFTLNEGTITSKDRGIYNETATASNGAVIINGGVINTTDYSIYNDSALALETTPSVKINGGEITSKEVVAVYNNKSGRVEIGNATITGQTYGVQNNSTGTVIVNGAHIKGVTLWGIYNAASSATITIYDGYIEGEVHGVGSASSAKTTFNIYGGTLKGYVSDGLATGAGVITIGIDDGNVSTTTPHIEGKRYGINKNSTSAKVYFNDGIIISNTSTSLYGGVTGTATGHAVNTVTNEGGGQTSTLTPIYSEYDSQGNFVKAYSTLATAFEGATSGNTIKPQKTLTEKVAPTLPADKTIILDMNNQTLTLSGVSLTNNGNLQISGEGSLINTKSNTIKNNGTLSIEEGITVTGVTTYVSGATGAQSTIDNYGNLTLNGGTIIAKSADAIFNESTGKITINDGIIEGNKAILRNFGTANTEEDPSVKILGGTLTAKTANGITNKSSGLLYIAGGTITSKQTLEHPTIYNETGKVKITGGTIISETERAVSNYYEDGYIEITGGTITGEYAVQNNGTMVITGGIMEGTSGSGVINNATLTLGNDDGTISIDSPKLIGTPHGINNQSTFNFYDGIIVGDKSSSILGTVTDKPDATEVYKLTIDNQEFAYLVNENVKASYTVEHYIEKTDGTYELKETENLSDTPGKEVTAIAKQYETYTENQEHSERCATGTVIPDGSLVLKLYYTRNSYELTLVKGDYIESVTGSGSYKFGDVVEITAVAENNEEYTYSNFTWEAPEDVIIDDLQAKTTKIIMPAKAIEITAKQERTATEYSITYDLAGGTVSGINPDKYTVESDEITLINPTKEMYVFTGWTGTDLTELTKTVTIPKGSTGNREYTANWEEAVAMTTENEINTYHLTVQSAIDEVDQTGKVTLLKDRNINQTDGTAIFGAGKTIELELNNKILTVTEINSFVNHGTLTVNGIGTIRGENIEEGNINYIISNSGGNLTLNSNVLATSSRGVIFSSGNLDIDGATIMSTSDSNYAISNKGNLNLNSGIINSTFSGIYNNGTLELNGGTISTEHFGINNLEASTVEFNSGKIIVSTASASEIIGIYNSSTKDNAIVMNGGEIIAEAKGSGYAVGINSNSSGDINIVNGTIDISAKDHYALGINNIETGDVKIETGSTIIAKSTNNFTRGIVTYRGNVNINGATITAIGGGSTGSYGVFSYADVANTIADISVIGGTIIGQVATGSGNAAGIGLSVNSNVGNASNATTLNISGGANIKGISDSGIAFGIHNLSSSGNISINGANISANSNTGREDGINNKGNNELIITGTVSTPTIINETLTSTDKTGHGIYQSGGKLTLTNGYTIENSIGIEYPFVKGSKYGVYVTNGCEFNFYDGLLEGTNELAIYGTVTNKPNSAEIRKETVEDRQKAYLYNPDAINNYGIIYNLDGGIVDGENPTIFTAETEEFTLINPTKENYVFTGWTGTGLTELTKTVTIPKGSTGSRTYTANWAEAYYYNQTANNYYVTLNEAINASPNNSTISVIKNANETITPTVETGKNLVLDLSDKTVMLKGVSLTNNGTLKITGESGTLKSTIQTIDNKTTGILNKEGNCTITGSGQYSTIYNSGKMTLTEGLITSDVYGGIYNQNPGQVTVNGGKIETPKVSINTWSNVNTENLENVEITEKEFAVLINDGEIKSETANAITNYSEGGAVCVNGGYIYSSQTEDMPTIYNETGVIKVLAGTIISENDRAVCNYKNEEEPTVQGGEIIITGGELIGKVGVQNIENSTLTIGTDDNDISTSSPIIKGKEYGVLNAGNFNYYDGVIQGKTNAISITGGININIPKDYEITYNTETITENGNQANYEVARLNKIKPQTCKINYYDGTTLLGNSEYIPETEFVLVKMSDLGESKEGYTFAGWTTSETSLEIEFEDGACLLFYMDDDIDLYAVWKRDVTFYSGENLENSETKVQYYNSKGGNYSVETPTQLKSIDGWTALGWREDTLAQTNQIVCGDTIESSASRFYGTYERDIIFKSGSGNITTQEVTQYYNSNNVKSEITMLTPTEINGWTTDGWRYDGEPLSKIYSAGQTITPVAQTEYYAVYSRNIQFISGIDSATTKNVGQYFNSKNAKSAVVMQTPMAIDTWTALGWRDDTTIGNKEYDIGSTITPVSITKYYAVYSRNITLKYDPNGGTGTIADQTTQQLYNTNGGLSVPTFTLKANTFTRTNYVFSKWSDETTNAVQYAPGDTYNSFVPTVANPTTIRKIYAVWKEEE